MGRGIWLSLFLVTLTVRAWAGSPIFVGTWSASLAESVNTSSYGDSFQVDPADKKKGSIKNFSSRLNIQAAADDVHDFFIDWQTFYGFIPYAGNNSYYPGYGPDSTSERFQGYFLCTEKPAEANGTLVTDCSGDNLTAEFKLELLSENTGVLTFTTGNIADRHLSLSPSTSIVVKRSSALPANFVPPAIGTGNPDFVGDWFFDQGLTGDDALTVEQSFDTDYTHVIYWRQYNRYLLCHYASLDGKTTQGKLVCDPKYPAQGTVTDPTYEFDLRSSTIAYFQHSYIFKRTN